MTDTELQHLAVDRVTSKIRKHVSSMAHRDHTNKTRLPDELLALLGCPHLGLRAGYGLIVPEVNVACAAVIGDALVKVLTLVARNFEDPACDAASVISGLYRNACWQLCLLDESTTYALAAAVCEFVEGYSPTLRLDHHVAPEVCALLNEWLRPASPWIEVPSKFDLADRLFGPAWGLVSLPDATRAMSELIYQERPPFLPGLCPAHQRQQSAPLPLDLGLSS